MGFCYYIMHLIISFEVLPSKYTQTTDNVLDFASSDSGALIISKCLNCYEIKNLLNPSNDMFHLLDMPLSSNLDCL